MNLNELIVYIQRSKLQNRSLSIDPLAKLTVEEQIAIEVGGGGNSLTTLALADASALAGASQVVPGAPYLITGTSASLYGGTDILVWGTSPSSFSSNGWGLFYIPIYSTYTIWDINGEYSAGNRVIWGGQVWLNVTGNNGGNDGDNFNLNNTDWTVIPTTDDTAYSITLDEISYDYQSDNILMRFDSIGNNRISLSVTSLYWWFCENNPIKVFCWGNYYDGSSGVSNCSIRDSYFNCLNIDRYCNITDVTLSDMSSVSFLDMSANSSIWNLQLSQASTLYSLTLVSASIEALLLDGESYADNVTLNNSSMSYVYIREGSTFENVTLNNGSNIEYLSLRLQSFLSDVSLDDTTLRNITGDNNSYFSEFNCTNGTYMFQITLVKSQMYSIVMNQSQMFNITMDDSAFNSLNCSAGYSLWNIRYTSATSHFNPSNNLTGGSENTSVYERDTIKYQFSVDVSGLDSSLVGVMPQNVLPAGWFVYSYIVQAAAIDTSDIATINLGSGANNSLIFTLPATTLNNAIYIGSPAQGAFAGSAIGADDSLACFVEDSTEFGSFWVEVVLKNISFTYDND